MAAPAGQSSLFGVPRRRLMRARCALSVSRRCLDAAVGRVAIRLTGFHRSTLDQPDECITWLDGYVPECGGAVR